MEQVAAGNEAPHPALRLREIRKSFPGVVALDGVSLEVLPGEVHAVVGENGAGKSTLMSVASGALAPDAGTVEISGRVLERPSPATARALGIAVVYQQTSVLDELTVAENFAFSMPPERRPPLRRAGRAAREQLAAVGAELDPSSRVIELSTAERQLLEIAKALALEATVLVLDEPTEALTATESERLFAQIRAMRDRGTAVVYISHRLAEVRALADRLTVLRDGRAVGTFAASDVSDEQIVQAIVGAPVEHAFPPKGGGARPGETLVVRGLCGPGFHGIDMEIAPGEIVGFAGVEGNGQRELIRALGGLEPSSGVVRLGDRTLDLDNATRALASGVVCIPGDRLAEGIFPALSVRENVTMASLGQVATAGIVNRRRQAAAAREQAGPLRIKAPSLETPVSSLSGGNQQKALLARSLLAGPRVLLADEPTRGVDVGARSDLYGILRAAADSGTIVVVLSSDSLELQGLCDRVFVFSRGQIARELKGEEIDEEAIAAAAIGSTLGSLTREGQERRLARLRRFAAGDYAPSLAVAAMIVILGAYTSAHSDFFLTQRTLTNLMLIASALAFVSFAQLVVMLVGGIDLSVGPLTGLVVMLLSFLADQGTHGVAMVLAIAAVVGLAALVGLVNHLLSDAIKLGTVLATLVTFIVIQGVSQTLRSAPGGSISGGLVGVVTTRIGPIPVAFLVAAVLAVAAEIALRWSRIGLELRAVGSSPERARFLGARLHTTSALAFVGCSLFAALGGIMLAAQVQIGDPLVGVNY
ncbi:MAG: transporter related protein, partial [Actinomycetia bacterium]|nr:transporter related protein [Actinomycetes bacterium]